jgi:hypothetical protein
VQEEPDKSINMVLESINTASWRWQSLRFDLISELSQFGVEKLWTTVCKHMTLFSAWKSLNGDWMGQNIVCDYSNAAIEIPW